MARRSFEPTLTDEFAGPNLGGREMLPRTRGIPFSKLSRAILLVATLLLLSQGEVLAQQNRHHIVLREEISSVRREELATKLQSITGFADLRFDADGILNLG